MQNVKTFMEEINKLFAYFGIYVHFCNFDYVMGSNKQIKIIVALSPVSMVVINIYIKKT